MKVLSAVLDSKLTYEEHLLQGLKKNCEKILWCSDIPLIVISEKQ